MMAEMGDISRFDDVKEIQKLSGLGLVTSSSGKHKGETKISHRGRKRLRYWLFQAAKSAVAHAEEFRRRILRFYGNLNYILFMVCKIKSAGFSSWIRYLAGFFTKAGNRIVKTGEYPKVCVNLQTDVR